jgi:hypothetical protein
MQGHPEAPRLWTEHADQIIRKLDLKPVNHDPCFYSGKYKGTRALLKCQDDNFKIATAKPWIAGGIFDDINNCLTFPLECMGLVSLINGIDVLQTRDYIKISVKTYLERICERHLETWMIVGCDKVSTSLKNEKEFVRGFLAAADDNDPDAQANLAKEVGFGYRSGVGKAIFASVTTPPDTAHALTQLSQHNLCPHKLH